MKINVTLVDLRKAFDGVNVSAVDLRRAFDRVLKINLLFSSLYVMIATVHMWRGLPSK